MLPTISGEFTLTADPELRFTPSGMAVCKVRLAANKQKQVNGEWVDDRVLFIDGTAFKKQAENIAESCLKGMRVVVTGKVQTEQWEDKTTNEKRSKITMTIDDIGPSLRFDTASVNRAERATGDQQRASSPAEDPWAVPVDDSQPPY